MAEHSTFFDSTQNDPRIYQSADWAEYMRQVMGGLKARDVVGTGVSRYEYQFENNLLVRVPGNNMTSVLGAGAAFVDGRFYKNDSSLVLTHEVADPTNDRFDTIVLRLDLSQDARHIRAFVKEGLPSPNPVAPAPVWRDTVKEIQLATVRIRAGMSYIATGTVTDTRADEKVCGYLPLHNIYRGLMVNENGAVTMPNQSFIKTEATVNIPLTQSTDVDLPLTGVKYDKQQEIVGNTFVPKTDGIFNIWVEVGFPEAHLPAGSTVEVYVYVNGVESFPLLARVSADPRDNYFIGSGFDQLQKGDVVKFMLRNRDIGSGKAVNLVRTRIAKIG